VSPDGGLRAPVREAFRLLDLRRFVLGVHDASFPSDEADDIGRGAPASPAGLRFLRFVRDLGFDGVQLGPQGRTSGASASPYEGTLFSRDPLSISLASLAAGDGPWGGLLSRAALDARVAERPAGARARVPYPHVRRVHRAALREAFLAWKARLAGRDAGARELGARLARFAEENASWLERDLLFEAALREHGRSPWRKWSGPGAAALDGRLLAPRPGEEAACEVRRGELRLRHGAELDFERFAQFVAHAEHERLRSEAAALGLRVFGDLQIGGSDRDAWAFQALFLEDYAMGAPPSRTNPEGQPWHYPVLDPDRYGERDRPGPALRLVAERVEKAFREYDGLRVDHPHGWISPWVYRRDAPDPVRAVQEGARLFDSPDLPDHPALARYAIVRPDQLRRGVPRHADDWVAALEPMQVDRYSRLFDVLVDCARRHGRGPEDLPCEVLSTLPYPVRRVLERHGLGRFRVTQKADLRDPRDVYRSENAAPADWIMVGNHDTEPLWARIEAWRGADALAERARYLAERLVPEPGGRAEFAARLERDPGLLAQAHFADLLAGPARHVFVFFTDLLGMREPYNRPGSVSPENWSLRVPSDYARLYRECAGELRALHLPTALALALRARGAAAAVASGLLPWLETQARSRLAPA
jgi:4-alpha-glucanotransferase